MRRQAPLTAFAAHALAWAAFLWLALWPNYYRGVSVRPALPGEAPGETQPISASLIAVNGLRVIPLLLLPVALTGLGLVLARFDARRPSRLGLWSVAFLMGIFCIAGAFSIGIFYLPSALATVLAALKAPRAEGERPL